ncbi:MAG: hypothetical protein RLZZ253_2868 [Verrucomicrobiota bacterium]
MNPRNPSPHAPNIGRRQFLRGALAALALPPLETWSADSAPTGARNFVAVGTYLGWHQNAFFPKQTGAGYAMPETLSPLEPHRDAFTVFSGLDHRAANGHAAWSNYLSGVTPNSYSLDQRIADELGQNSRFPSIELTAGSGELPHPMSFTRRGVGLPMIQRPSVLYRRLFVSKADAARTDYLLRSGRSGLDLLKDDAKRLQAAVSNRDKDRLEEYFESFRAVEKRMERQLNALHEPLPETEYQLPTYDPITPNLQIEAETILYHLMALALETESTRVLTLQLDGLGQVFSLDGRTLGAGYHGLSHHGNDPRMIRDLVTIETAHIHCFAGFLQALKDKKSVRGKTLLEETVVLLGTGTGDASRHSNANLPTLVAGGGFQHGRHIAIDPQQPDAPLLGDLYVTLMQRLGMEVDKFSNASRNLNQIFS